MKKSIPYQKFLSQQLADPKEARVYIEVALEEFEQDRDPVAFLLALRSVADAKGGIAQLAERTGLNREHLYRILSAKGNPRLETIGTILSGLGFRLSVLPLGSEKKIFRE